MLKAPDRIPIKLLTVVSNGKYVTHQHLNVVRFADTKITESKEHRYINLYLNENDARWHSCIELVEIEFDWVELLLINISSDNSRMVYRVYDTEHLIMLQEAIER